MRRDTRNMLLLLAAALLLGSAQSAAAPRPKTKRMTRAELEELARDVGFPDPKHAATIAMRESGGDPRAVNDTRGVPKAKLPPGTTNEHSVGLWQINLLAHTKWTEQELLDPRRNAEAAFEISKRGTDWRPWSTHKPDDERPAPASLPPHDRRE